MARAAVVLVVLWAVLASSAHASATQESVFMDDNRLLYRSNEVTDDTLRELVALGVDRVRVTVLWRNFAPTTRPAGFDGTSPASYPTHEFDNHDHLVRKARQFGIEVLFNVTGGGPDWAVTGKPIPRDRARQDGDLRPSAKLFADFVTMIGRRYDGSFKDENQGGLPIPRVTAWSIWNEPNRGTLLAPQWRQDKRTRKWTMVGPRRYRGLVRAGLDGLARSGHADDTVLIGETAPLGNRAPGNRSHISPLPWLRELFCLNRRLAPYTGASARRRGCDFERRGAFRVSGFAHHPYSVLEPPATPSAVRGDVRLADGARLQELLDAAARAGRIPAGLPVWYTEYGYESVPDPHRGLPLERQAAWNAEAELIARSDPRVVAHTHFLLRDDDPQAQYKPSDSRYWGTYQSGLRTREGEPKPALNAFRLPLVAQPGVTPSLWGLVRPLRDKQVPEVVLEYRAGPGGSWTDVRTLAVDTTTKAFTADLTGAQPGEYRVRWSPARPARRTPGPLDPEPPAPPKPFVSEPVRSPVG